MLPFASIGILPFHLNSRARQIGELHAYFAITSLSWLLPGTGMRLSQERALIS
jgi:hypothetical protein